tara:strand:- start:243 stop:779 length:537 start_codon:yes stop_codon:yes gene_type:complete
MKLTKSLFIIICTLCIDTNYASSGIDELKESANDRISAIKTHYFLFKNKIISPYNKKQFPYEIFLDSLYTLSERLGKHRENMYFDLIGLDLTDRDIQFFENLNRESILLFNIIIGFRDIYCRYLSNDNASRRYSFAEYTLEMKNLLVLEQKLFSKKFELATKKSSLFINNIGVKHEKK